MKKKYSQQLNEFCEKTGTSLCSVTLNPSKNYDGIEQNESIELLAKEVLRALKRFYKDKKSGKLKSVIECTENNL